MKTDNIAPRPWAFDKAARLVYDNDGGIVFDDSCRDWDDDMMVATAEFLVRASQQPEANAKPTLSPGERDAIAREFAFDMGISAVVAEERIRKAIDAALLKAGVGVE